MKKIFILSVLLLILVSSIFSQNKVKDSTSSKKHNHFKIFDEEFFYAGRPFIDISYGQTNFSFANSNESFQHQGIIETKLGYGFLGKTVYSPDIARYRNRFLFGSMISNSLSLKTGGNSNKNITWRFGFGDEEGYGYKIGKKSSINLYSAGTMNWTRYDDGRMGIDEYGNVIPGGKLFDFYETFRFGTSMEAGVIVPLGNMVNIQAMYDRAVIFPRHLFWKHLGSVVIEEIGQTAIDGFVKAIMRSSPYAGPIVSFILKNGFAYGIYELRKENMNWPFETAEPLFNESFKLGITFMF